VIGVEALVGDSVDFYPTGLNWSSSRMIRCSALASAEPVPPRQSSSPPGQKRWIRGRFACEEPRRRVGGPRRQPSTGFEQLDAVASHHRLRLHSDPPPPRSDRE
jgi:hypothetical protein